MSEKQEEIVQILPCPFCKGEVDHYVGADNIPGGDNTPYVQFVCAHCGYTYRWGINSSRRRSSKPVPLLSKFQVTIPEMLKMLRKAVRVWNEER